jgi:imidazolonepropionase
MSATVSGSIAAQTLVTPTGPGPVRGSALDEPLVIERGALAWEEGRITYVGPAEGCPGSPEVLEGRTIAPGFVDCHTHLPFIGWRADEFEARLAGASYRDLHGREGGIFRSSRLLNDASDDDVLAFCRPLLAEMAAHGTTALELKTGYGLSVEAELRQARLARRLAAEAQQTCTVTLLPCHAVPKDVERAEWVRRVCEALIPPVGAEGLADAVDIYVEDIAFSLEDLRTVAEAAAGVDLPLRVHADQLGASGAAEAAVALGARSADHLNHVSEEGILALGSGDTVGVLLPTSTFFIRATPPSVRSMIEAGAAVAIASDFNPGTSPALSMPEVVAMACTLYGLTPHEALCAATVNPSWVLGFSETLGTLEVGKRADLVVLDGDAFRQVPYRPGHDPVVRTVIGGRTVFER